MPLQGQYVISGLRLATINKCAKFEISTLTHYKDAVTGCDTVSHIVGCGKKTSWSATTGLTDTLVVLCSDPQQLSLHWQHMQTLERFVVVMYSKG